MIYAGSVHILTVCCKIQLSTLNGPSRASNRRHRTLPEWGGQPRICPLPPTPDVPTTSPQPSSPSTCSTALNKRMATPFKGQLGSTKLYYNHHTYTKRATQDGHHTWRVRMCFDDGLPMMFNHSTVGAVKQLFITLAKVNTELLTSKRSRHVSLLRVEHRLLAKTTYRWRGFTWGRTFQKTIHDVKRNKRLARWQ